MKKVNVVLFVFLGFFIFSSTVTAASLSFKGYGAWRDKNNGVGKYSSYSGISWNKCHSYCVKATNCKGIEYAIKSNGASTCEVHSGKFHHLQGTVQGTVGIVWLRK